MLQGNITDSICSLTDMNKLSLSNNPVGGKIPDCIGKLQKLESLTFTNTLVQGNLPISICTISRLKYLHSSQTAIARNASICIGNLTNLEEMTLTLEEVPISIGNLKLLSWLELCLISPDSENTELPRLPDIFSQLTRLRVLIIKSETMVGALPTVENRSEIDSCELVPTEYFCRPTGWIPPNEKCDFSDIPTCRDCEILHEWQPDIFKTADRCCSLNVEFIQCENQKVTRLNLSGRLSKGTHDISEELSELALLKSLDLSMNSLNQLPDLGTLTSLKYFNLSSNNLASDVFTSLLGLADSLTVLDLSSNDLGGPIPDSVGIFSKLDQLYLSNNKLEGSIPVSLGDARFLRVLDLSDNSITGAIPRSISNLPLLQECNLDHLSDLCRNYTVSVCGTELPGKTNVTV